MMILKANIELRNLIDNFSTFLYFSRARKCKNRIRREILGWGMGGVRSLPTLLLSQNSRNACSGEKIHPMYPES